MTSKAVVAIDGGVRLHVRAQPGAKKTELAGSYGDAVKVRIHAPPVDGKANEEVAAFLARHFGISRSNVTLVRGDKSRDKTFELHGVDLAFVLARLA